MSKQYCFTIGVTLYVHAVDETEAIQLVEEIDEWPVRIAALEVVEQYDPEKDEVIA